MIKFGGNAGLRSVTFRSETYWVKASLLGDDSLEIISEKLSKIFKIINWLCKIPFIRGMALIMALWVEVICRFLIKKFSVPKIMFILAFTLFLVAALMSSDTTILIRIIAPWLAMTSNAIIIACFIPIIIKSRGMPLQVFAFHGAEHMAANTYEAGEKLTFENLKKSSRIHSRCGTNFASIFFPIYLILLTLLPQSYPWINLLVICSLSYELVHPDNKTFSKVTIRWGNWLQKKITTRDPTEWQLRVAGAALEVLISLEEKGEFPQEVLSLKGTNSKIQKAT